MNPDAIDDLIQTVLEGGASPSDVSRLEHLIATDEHVRERHARLKQAFETLALGATLEEPPAGLRDGILAEIRQQRVARPVRPVARPAFSWFRLALPLAACAAAAVVLLWNGRATAPRPAAEGVTGAIAAAPQHQIAIGQGDQAVSIAWHDLPGGRFALDLEAGASPVTVTIEPRNVRLDRPAEAIALDARATDTILGAVMSEAPAVRVTLTWADGRSATREVGLGEVRH